jgi:uncharacterized Zn-finger protein
MIKEPPNESPQIANFWICNFCEQRLKNKHHLIRHKILHLDYDPFKCDFPKCQYSCKRKDYLSKHIKKFHAKKFDSTSTDAEIVDVVANLEILFIDEIVKNNQNINKFK